MSFTDMWRGAGWLAGWHPVELQFIALDVVGWSGCVMMGLRFQHGVPGLDCES